MQNNIPTYKRYKLLPVIILLAFPVIFSCNKVLDLPEIGGKKQIVVLGEIIANDSIYIRAGQSVPISSSSSLNFEITHDLSLTLQEANGNAITLPYYDDGQGDYLHTLPYTSPTTLKENTSYTLTATHPSLGIATATVQIPQAFTASVSDISHTTYAGDSAIKIKLRIDDPSATANYYVIEAVKQIMTVYGYFKYLGTWVPITDNKAQYEQEKANGTLVERYDTTYYRESIRNLLYTRDVNADNTIAKGPDEPNRRILLRDATFNGQSYNTDVYIQKDIEYTYPEGPKGRLLLIVKSVDEKYYKYLKLYDEQIDNGGMNSLAQPIKINGNISNGVGILGGVYKNQFLILHDTWTF